MEEGGRKGKKKQKREGEGAERSRKDGRVVKRA